MRYYLSNLLVQTLILSSAISFAAAARPFPTPSNLLSQKALEVRGGWTPLDGVDTTKVITKLGLAVGTATALSSKTVLDKSGIENVDPISLLVTRRIGGIILSFSIASYFLLFHDASASTAVGIACLPTIIELSKTLFDGTHKDLGFPAAGQAIVLVITACFSFSLLSDSDFSKDNLLKIYSGWLLFNGLLMGCFPKLACKAWGEIDATSLPVLQQFTSLWGFGILSLGTLSGFLATGVMTNKALTLGAIPFISRLVLSKFV